MPRRNKSSKYKRLIDVYSEDDICIDTVEAWSYKEAIDIVKAKWPKYTYLTLIASNH